MFPVKKDFQTITLLPLPNIENLNAGIWLVKTMSRDSDHNCLLRQNTLRNILQTLQMKTLHHAPQITCIKINNK